MRTPGNFFFNQADPGQWAGMDEGEPFDPVTLVPISKFEPTRRCYRCGEAKVLTDFSRDRTKTLGYSYCCKDCDRDRKRETRATDKAESAEMLALFQEHHPERPMPLPALPPTEVGTGLRGHIMVAILAADDRVVREHLVAALNALEQA